MSSSRNRSKQTKERLQQANCKGVKFTIDGEAPHKITLLKEVLGMDKELIKIAEFLAEAEEYFEDELLKLAEETKEKAKLLSKIKAALGKVKASVKAHPVKWGLGAASTAAGSAALAAYLKNKKKRKELEAFLNSIEE